MSALTSEAGAGPVAERDHEAAVAGERAVLAELRAIGLSFAASTGVLRAGPAREGRGRGGGPLPLRSF